MKIVQFNTDCHVLQKQMSHIMLTNFLEWKRNYNMEYYKQNADKRRLNNVDETCVVDVEKGMVILDKEQYPLLILHLCYVHTFTERRKKRNRDYYLRRKENTFANKSLVCGSSNDSSTRMDDNNVLRRIDMNVEPSSSRGALTQNKDITPCQTSALHGNTFGMQGMTERSPPLTNENIEGKKHTMYNNLGSA